MIPKKKKLGESLKSEIPSILNNSIESHKKRNKSQLIETEENMMIEEYTIIQKSWEKYHIY